MPTSQPKYSTLTIALAGVLSLSPITLCANSTNLLGFEIAWPITDPTVTNKPSRPLLTGELRAAQTGEVLTVKITLKRPDDEAHRAYWNRMLYYREYDWMSALRVWDSRKQWLYPNLAFLFTIHGEERIGRYGGWDSGHQNDNDFGGLLLRKYDAGGKESPTTKKQPLVTACWHPVTDKRYDKFTIVHQASSEELTLRLDSSEGRADLWLVYGDFMKSPVPPNWPKDEEFCGNTLAFFQIVWQKTQPPAFRITLSQKRPEASTGFDWELWIGRYSLNNTIDATSVLSEAP
jgi:hypothetical protein